MHVNKQALAAALAAIVTLAFGIAIFFLLKSESKSSLGTAPRDADFAGVFDDGFEDVPEAVAQAVVHEAEPALIAVEPQAPAKAQAKPSHRLTPKVVARHSHGSGGRANLSLLGSKQRVARYVAVDLLNVRSAPSVDAPVIAKLTRGTMFRVTLVGDWARLGDGVYVQLRYLSDKPLAVHLASRR
jgi:hypothetical protein